MLVKSSFPDVRAGSRCSQVQWWGATEDSYSTSPALPATPGVISSTISPSGRFIVVFRKVGEGSKASQVAEVRSREGVVLTTTPLDKAHGEVRTGSDFGGVAWLPDETAVVYCAEAKEPDKPAFWDVWHTERATPTKPKDSAEADDMTPSTPPAAKSQVGEAFRYAEDWGEQMVGTARPLLHLLQPWSGRSPTPIPMPEALQQRLAWGDPVVTPDGKWVFAVATATLPRRLGRIYCLQRPQGVFAISVAEWVSSLEASNPSAGSAASGEAADAVVCDVTLVSAQEAQARSPRLSPDGSTLVFLGRGSAPEDANVLRTHNGSFALRCFDVAAWTAQGHPSTEVSNSAPAPAADTAPLHDVVYKAGLLPAQKQVPHALLSTLLPYIGDQCPNLPSELQGQLPADFPGLYTLALPRHPWSPDGSTLFLSTAWASRIVTLWLHLQGSSPAARVSGIMTSLQAVGPDGAAPPSPREVLAAALAGAEESGQVSPTSAAHWEYVSVVAKAWGPLGPLVAVGCPIAHEYLATANVDWEGGRVTLQPHAQPFVVHAQALATANKLAPPSPAQASGTPTSFSAAKWLASCTWRVLRITPSQLPDVSHIEAVLVLPRSSSPLPLIVVPHGGPHGVYPTLAFESVAFWSATGHAVLMVNYRGSTGFGDVALNTLPGRCGSLDISDTVDATRAALALPTPWETPARQGEWFDQAGAVITCAAPPSSAVPEAWMTQAPGSADAAPADHWLDPSRVSVIGGSHGGFIGGHLVGQHPTFFKAAVLRNPVTDVSQMVGVTDIPDWCWVEAAGVAGESPHAYDFTAFKPPPPDLLAAMQACSPIAHVQKVKAAVLLTIGGKDRRVPPSQGTMYYHALKAQGSRTAMLWYPDDVHSLAKPITEADALIHMVLWLRQHDAGPAAPAP